MNRKLLLFIVLILLVIGSIYALIGRVNTLSNGLTEENLTFISDQNITRFILIPIYANVTNATLIIEGFEAT